MPPTPERKMEPAATVRLEAELTVPTEAVAEGLGEEKERAPAVMAAPETESEPVGEAVAMLTLPPEPEPPAVLIWPVVRLAAEMMVRLPLEPEPLPPEKMPRPVPGVSGVVIAPEAGSEPE
jgi:hypothetical protein